MAGRIENFSPVISQAAGAGRPDFSQLASDVRRLVSKLSPEAQHVAKSLESGLLKAAGLGPKASLSTKDSFESGSRRPAL